ncbi:MAG: 2-hydroxyacid dehydrogenase [Granulosicoccus sp.]
MSFESYDAWDSEPMNQLFTVHPFPASGNPQDLDESLREQITAFAFKGHSSLGADIMDAFPNLGMIANYGVGYDTIDVAHATSRGIKVSNTPDVLTNDVADLAIGMLLAINRDIVGASQWVTSGNWASSGAYPIQRTLSGASVGIAGLGRIGRAVAERLQGFNTNIHYYSRSKKQTPDWTYHDDLVSLAKAVDILMVTVSGGPETIRIISKDVIAALGSDGLLVNVARGSTVDEEALLNALESSAIRGLASDVFNNEPNIDPRFLALNNVLLQPHQSSGTIETRKIMGELQRDNLQAYFADKPLVTPVN